MSSKTVRFLKIGADPEFLFGKSEDEHVDPEGASTTLGPVQPAGQIGCDGHAYTGELRPPPAHNVRLLMHNIAALVQKTGDFAASKDLRLFAVPILNNEVLGGHIHLSMRVRTLEPIAWRNDWSRTPPEDFFVIDHVAQALNYLLIPLEFWFHSPPLQRRRFSQYPTSAQDVIRLQKYRKNSADAFFHCEYRSPSTWLVHPAVAYLYLGMAKLVMLNFDKIPKAGALKPNRNDIPHPFETLQNRLSGLLPTARLTPDLRNLEEALDFVDRNRRHLNRPYNPVDVDAWKQVLLREEVDE